MRVRCKKIPAPRSLRIIWLEESKERGLKTGVIDAEIGAIGDRLLARYKAYFDSVKPTTYYGDISSKNIMIQRGVFNGLVDLDGLTQGDPLEAIGRIQLSWYGTRHGELYTRAIMDELGLEESQREVVLMYALLNKISWSSENGIQFNENTKDEVNWEKARADKAVIKIVAGELKIRSG
jgi:aminoglycoside phosphotransferase (APT) family kinase protein